MTISEICRFVGIAPHTLRFYERHFPSLLTADRTVGGHRIYSPNQLENLKKILKCIKEEKLSIKEAQQRLEEGVDAHHIPSQKKNAVDEIPEMPFSNALEVVMKKLDELFSHNVRMDKLIEKLILERDASGKETKREH